jgi:hypothetical protein
MEKSSLFSGVYLPIIIILLIIIVVVANLIFCMHAIQAFFRLGLIKSVQLSIVHVEMNSKTGF